MRTTLLLVVLVGCSDASTAGCTLENCHRMLECRVGLVGGPSTACFAITSPPPGFDFGKYCVESCRHQGAGALVSCIADRADRCDAAPGWTAKYEIVAECESGSGVPGPDGGTASCSPSCDAARKSCDDACVGQTPDAGFAVCADCSAQCTQTWFDCTGGCS
jgi:hypothetical protein